MAKLPSYHELMRLYLNLALFSTLAMAAVNPRLEAAVNPRLEKVQSIYILPMGSGMDQFLANRIARLGKIQVVADPQSADAVLTDRLGEVFEKKLDILYKKPPADPDPVMAKTTDADTKATDAKAAEKTDDMPAKTGDAIPTTKAKDTVAAVKKREEDPGLPRTSSFGRGKGTLFLVDRRTRNVIWSIYERPKNTSADELNKTAERVVNKLKKDLEPQPVSSQ